MAITFGPNLMWAPVKLQSQNTAVTIQKQQMVIQGLLENAKELFELSEGSVRSRVSYKPPRLAESVKALSLLYDYLRSFKPTQGCKLKA